MIQQDDQGSDTSSSGDEMVENEPGYDEESPPNGFSEEPVRYFDGVLKLTTTDISSNGFGKVWGMTRSWTNGPGYANTSFYGSGWLVSQLPYMQSWNNGNTMVVITNGVNSREFDANGGNWVEHFYLQDKLTYNSTAQEFTLTDTKGNQIKFSDFSTSLPANQQGQFKSLTDRDGNVTQVTSRTSDGKPAEIQRSTTVNGSTYTESYLYTYISSGTNAGLIQNVTLRRQVNGGSWTTIRQAAYTYYDGVLAHGNANDLRTATIEDGSGNALDTKYYRYYVNESSGYQHGLKYVFNPGSYARLVAALGTNIDNLTDTQVAPYADNYFEYDTSKRVTKEVTQGRLFTHLYAYASSSFSNGYNSWKYKTTETLPDNNQLIVYSNYAGEAMLTVFYDTTTLQKWETFNKYDSAGRVILRALPSAITGYDDTKSDLLNSQSGNYQYMSNNSGLLEITDYASTTTATSSTPGNVAGYLQDTKVQQGQQGTAILVSARQYIAQTAGSITIYPVANMTRYRNTNGTGAETTSYSYTFFSGTDQIQSAAVSLPVISAAQNGPGASDVLTVFNDAYGRPIWSKDADGFINYIQYDPATGAVTKTIRDVDTTRTGDFQNLPSGWSTPSGGGLHLITLFQVDGLGRPTKITDPLGNVSYEVYLDTNHESRTYPGWNSSTHLPTGPTQDVRLDETNSYVETLTMSAAPAVDGNGNPTGGEAISNVQTLSRTYLNSANQVIYRDNYFNLSGLTYSTSPNLGTENVNFYRTRYAYSANDHLNRIQFPTGTIQRTVYDSHKRVVSEWIGTNDTGATDSDPTGGGATGNNMKQIAGNVYDGGGVGDGNLTQITHYAGGSAPNRVTQNYFDWRDRLVATKSGVQASEDTTTHRPIMYYSLDNLGEVTAVDHYDGDGVTITFTNGVPNPPSSSLLRAHTAISYDDQGRVYLQQTFSVDQSNGTISTNSLKTNTWYNHRGQPIEFSVPGGLVSKTVYDGAGRVIKTYKTDGAGGTSWSAASSVANDNVLTETITSYDSDGNPILTTSKDRFHNETTLGELGNPTTGPLARVSYIASYYDAANRLTTTVAVGTNGGTAYTRPSTPPSPSDTVLVTSIAYMAAGWIDTVTDPRGIVYKSYYDNLGRLTKTVQDYTDGNPTNNSNKTTEYTYDGDGHTLTIKADMPGGAYQTTQYVFGVSITAGSNISSNDLVSAIQYPDKSTGNPSSSQQESFTVNALGQNLNYTDRNGNVHSYSYDVLGRLTADAVTTLGTGVDGTVRRIETAYDTGDRPYLFTSYNAASGGSIVNQVQDAYNGLGQLITEYQAHSGAVNTSTTPKVQYSYSLMAGGVNNSRVTSMTYPNGRVLNFNYATGVDNTISRLTSISDSSATLESLSYLGLSTVVDRSHPQPGVDLTYIKQTGESNGDAGDQYTGLDRFGRVVDQRWIITATGTATDRFQYGYDRDSNRLYRDNLVNSSFGELYHANGPSNGYDLLNQLTNFARGTLNSTKDTITSPSHSQSWAFDALGNWSSVTTDGSTQTRTANQQNEITSISGLTTPTYDTNGNMIGDQNGKTLIFDAWNRLVQVKNGSTILESYGYDGRGWRITENPGTIRDLYYSMLWQLLEEDVGGSMQDQYVWSPVYVDALVERDTSTQRMYVQQDANFNVTALVDTSGNVQERYVYDPFGAATILAPNWSTRGSSSYSWIYLHQGGRLDNATGLYAFRHRDLSPTLGRWVELDPLGLGPDSNPYRYVRNNPTGKADPSGFWPQWLNDAANSVSEEAQWYWNAAQAAPGIVVDTLQEGVDNVVIGVENGFNEVVNIEEDIANGAIGLVTNVGIEIGLVDEEDVYTFELQSQLFGAYEDAVHNGTQGSYLLQAEANVATFGIYGYCEAVNYGIQTGDWAPAQQYAGGMLAQALLAEGADCALQDFLINCFPSDTLVATEKGLRPICEVEASDRVWSYDFAAGSWRLAEVECRNDSKYNGPLVTLDVGIGEVTATAFHPFWVIEGKDLENRPPLRHVDVREDCGASLPGRWVNSHDLREGDIVFLRHSGAVPLRRVWQHNERTSVCNLTIRGLHTFAVGENQVLVHNTPGSGAGNFKPLNPWPAGIDAELLKPDFAPGGAGQFNLAVTGEGEVVLVPVNPGTHPNVFTGLTVEQAAEMYPVQR